MNVSDLNLAPCPQAALDLAARGWEIFPLTFGPEGEKKSHASAEFSGGRRWGATTDPAELRKMFRQWPAAGVGIATGPASGIFVIDVDTTEGHDVDGFASLAALEAEHGTLPATVTAESPSGGRHLYFRWPADGEPIGTHAGKVAPGVDQRGAGGMVAAPPTRKPGGAEAYRWITPPGRVAVADAPDWLLALCRRPVAADGLGARARASGPRIDTGRATAWAQAGLAGEMAKLFAAPVGKRNHQLNASAFALGQIVGGGALDHDDVRARLIGAAANIGLDAAETGATVASGMTAGMAEPRHPPEERASRARPDDGDPAGPDEGEEAPPIPEEADEFDLSHDALARDLGARSWDADARHVALWGEWRFWDATRWAPSPCLEELTRGRDYLNTRATSLLAWAERKSGAHATDGDARAADKVTAWAKGEARTLRHASTVAAVVGLARSNRASAAHPDDFDADPWLLGTPGGTVDLHTGTLRPARREENLTRQAAVAPASGTPHRWLAFLDEVMGGDAGLIGFLQRAAGYSLTGETREHKMLFAYGTGRNGKSTFLETLLHLWGDYSRRVPATSLLNSQGERHPTDLAGLRGARLAVGSELARGKSWDESAIKDMTGGDVLTARFMRQDFFDFRPQFTLWIAGNTLPSFRGVDEALRARVVLVPFTVTIPAEQRDPDLPMRLREEARQIMAWCIEGAVEWQRHGLMVPASVAAASRDYLDGEDMLGQFLADETVAEPGAFTTTTALHQRFAQWAQGQGLTTPWTLRTLQKEVASRGLVVTRRNVGAGFLGLRLQ